jgi:RNA polymerase sigma factor for flagellar operon FliA
MRAATAYATTGSGESADVLVRRHAELVKRIAYHLAGRLPPSVDVDDLMQAGMLGLLEAASHYAADRGASFETYAGIRIRGAMIDALRKLDWAPRSVHRRAREAAAAMRQIEVEFGREARDAEVAARMGLSIDEYHRVMHDASSCQIASLDEVSTASDVADRTADPLREAQSGEFREALAAAITGLPERERLVMSMYYDDELNLKEIGAVLEISESRVCQLHGQALVRLKSRLASWRGTGSESVKRGP